MCLLAITDELTLSRQCRLMLFVSTPCVPYISVRSGQRALLASRATNTMCGDGEQQSELSSRIDFPANSALPETAGTRAPKKLPVGVLFNFSSVHFF